MNNHNSELPPPRFFSKSTVIACITISVIGFLIYTGHGAHLMGYAPYLLILACPLMHLFMHHGHHHHEDQNTDSSQKGD